jgi:hypothetical protein
MQRVGDVVRGSVGRRAPVVGAPPHGRRDVDSRHSVFGVGRVLLPAQLAMVARSESMFGCYDSYSYRLWSLANVWNTCQREY